EDEAGSGRSVEGSLVGAFLKHGHDLHAVHRLRSGRVIIEDPDESPLLRSQVADRLPERLVVRAGRRLVGEHVGRRRQTVSRHRLDFLVDLRITVSASEAAGRQGGSVANVVVTGGAGFLGTRLARALLAAGSLRVAGAAASPLASITLIDRVPLPADLAADGRVVAVRGDLDDLLDSARDGQGA